MSSNPLSPAKASGVMSGGLVAGQSSAQKSDEIEHLRQLAMNTGRVEILFDAATKKFDVRAGGICVYGPNLNRAIRERIEIEVARVTTAIGADGGANEAYRVKLS